MFLSLLDEQLHSRFHLHVQIKESATNTPDQTSIGSILQESLYFIKYTQGYEKLIVWLGSTAQSIK